MATDIKTTHEDVDMAQCDGEKVVTMMDVLKEQEDFEEDANAVLGGSDDKNCTYPKGYIKRQAIYACMTCCSDAKTDPEKRAGVCLACSLICHENHELVELYTKRNFRCDCGNPKFNSHPCNFTQNKTDLNEDNKYNQNFSGMYCTCNRPYPDPESKYEDEMIQCIICEDWLHSSHLESIVPANDQYSEMICKGCMDKNEFLHEYSELIVNAESQNSTLINGDAINGEVNCTEIEQIDSSNTNLDIGMSGQKQEFLSSEKNSGTKDETSKCNELGDQNNKSNLETNRESVSDAITNSSDNPEQDNTKGNIMETESEKSNITKPSTLDETNGDKEEHDCTQPEAIKEDIDKNNIENTATANNEEGNSESTEKSGQIDNKQNEEIANENETEKLNDGTTESTLKETEANSVENTDFNKASDKETEGAENKINEEDAEKILEDKLLADPEDNLNVDSKELDNESTNKEISIQNDSNETSSINEEKEQCKSEKALDTSEMLEKLETSDEKPKEDVQDEDKTDPPIDTEMKSAEAEAEPELHEETSKDDISQDDKTDENQLENQEKNSEKRKLSTEDSIDDSGAKKAKLDDNKSNDCSRPKNVKRVHKGATFWPSNFRQKLCTCQECISMYKDLAVLFLIDPDDTVTAYENLGMAIVNGKPLTQYEKGLEALSSLDRVQQINALTEYNRMKDRLVDFLKSFKDRREIVKEEDIRAFFAGMKPKRQPDGVYFCR